MRLAKVRGLSRRCPQYDCVMMPDLRWDHDLDHAWSEGHGWVVHVSVESFRCAPTRAQGPMVVDSELLMYDRFDVLRYRRHILVCYWYIPAGGCCRRVPMMIASPSHCRLGSQAPGRCTC